VEMMIIVESSLPKTPGEHWQQLRQGSARTHCVYAVAGQAARYCSVFSLCRRKSAQSAAARQDYDGTHIDIGIIGMILGWSGRQDVDDPGNNHDEDGQ
jgi:hypothetical protein